MAATVAAWSEPSTRLAGVVLACGRAGSGRFAALGFEGTRVLEQLDGTSDTQRLRELLLSGPLICDAPGRAAELCERAGIRSPVVVWDVLELAGLLIPDCPNASLDHVGAFLGLEPPDDDGPTARAKLGLAVFRALLELLETVDNQTLLHVNRLAQGLHWPLHSLFRIVADGRARSTLEATALASATPIGAWIARGAGPRKRQQTEPEPEPLPVDLDDLARRFATHAALAQALPGYEPRTEQVRMAQMVGQTLNAGGELLIEAGTGTGKSLAYLLPAAIQAVQSNRRVVVTTATTTLQDQLFKQDLPLVQRALEGEVLKASVLKGRGNYLCLRRWQTLLHAGDLSADDCSLLIKTLFWLPRTRTGDRAELRLTSGEEEAWSRLSAVTEACTPTRCSYHRIGVCFLARARRAAEDSHIVITNHALLLTDLVTRSRVLPEYQVLIVDEAHHLEDEATAQLGWRLGERELLNRLERLWNVSVGHGATGVVPEAVGLIGTANGLRVPPELIPVLQHGERALLELTSHIHLVFEGLARLLDDPDQGVRGDESTLRITAAIRAGSAWQELESMWATAREQLEVIEGSIAEVVGQLEALPNAPEAARDLSTELAAQLDYWRDAKRRLSTALQMPSPGALYWIGTVGRVRAATLNAAPLEVATLLRERLFSTPEATILVSATLAIGGSFDYVKQRLGLQEAASAALGSPFDYERAALLYVPNDLPDPTQPGYQSLVERAILDVVTRLRGRTLVLFTSRAHLRTTYAALRDQLAALHITVLGQGIDESSRTRLLEAFRRGSQVALFGTNAFWEGIDVVGEALSCVVVARLPFAVPTDPIYAARSEQFEQPFMDYAVPQAVLRLKQGFGRLIRSSSDRGCVVVLDRRLVTRFYGERFFRSLPPATVKQGPARRTGAEVSSWLSPEAPQDQQPRLV